jgi:hypothetical protein
VSFYFRWPVEKGTLWKGFDAQFPLTELSSVSKRLIWLSGVRFEVNAKGPDELPRGVA